MTYLLTTEDANELCRKGNLIVLQYLVEILKVCPDIDGANLACEYGNLDVLKFLKVYNIFQIPHISPQNIYQQVINRFYPIFTELSTCFQFGLYHLKTTKKHNINVLLI